MVKMLPRAIKRPNLVGILRSYLPADVIKIHDRSGIWAKIYSTDKVMLKQIKFSRVNHLR